MDDTLSSDHVIAELIEMGFEFSNIMEAIKVVGPSVEAAVEFILNDPRRNNSTPASSSKSSTSYEKRLVQTVLPSNRVSQSTARDLQAKNILKKKKTNSGSKSLPNSFKASKEPWCRTDSHAESAPEALVHQCTVKEEEDIGPDWEQKAISVLQKHFGYTNLKGFQKEVITAWLAHRDCLVLAATGSGKSLCFQIPALLTGKLVVVISPLISLMHDQCLKLAKHGVSACFLGSGQTDSSIENKAMRGMYSIIYVCPETIVRLIKPLQGLAKNRGIALFAIDEVHCVSKWGHDFRPAYRRLSILRDNFRVEVLEFLKFDIPIMALTATATIHVREDILNSLCLPKETKIVFTSFFRPNLRFSVNHSATKSNSYQKDFRELINIYARKNSSDINEHGSDNSEAFSNGSMFETDVRSLDKPANERLSVEYLEDESDLLQGADDFDVTCGEFFGQSSATDLDICGLAEKYHPLEKLKRRMEIGQDDIGLTIIYVPTRKETVRISEFLCQAAIKAAPYHAKLPKSHLRRVHKEFHENALQVVVATIAFGMGIDKLNVRKIIHYGWPQSLEAYYQEAGRAGRDGNLADCILYANLLGTPSLLPSERSEEQTRQAYKMLSDCFRYGMNCSSCRAKVLVEYFGEQFSYEKCQMCDVCNSGPPELLNLKAEADAFLDALSSHYGETSFSSPYDHASAMFHNQQIYIDRPSTDNIVSKIKGKFPEFVTTDRLWWRGLARILEDKGLIRARDDKVYVQIKYPEPTELGMNFLQKRGNEDFYVYPEADMLILSGKKDGPYSSFSEWGKGWADPVIRHQRLEAIRGTRNSHMGRSRSRKFYPNSVRKRLDVKLSKRKR